MRCLDVWEILTRTTIACANRCVVLDFFDGLRVVLADQMHGKCSQTARRWVACVDRCVGSTVGLASPLSNLRRRG